MRYGSVCSGVEAATLAWEPLGWKPAFFSEIEKFPSEVLRQRWPNVPNLGDFTKIKDDDYNGKIELLTGGTPCQSFSMAGLRKGIKDSRGNLCLEFAKLAFKTKVHWILWENVPGVLSSNGGKDFAAFLSFLCGWEVKVPTQHIKQNGEHVKRWKRSGIITPGPNGFGLAWRVLDVQHVRVDGYPRAIPQRRRRLFVVGYIGDWKRAAAVLFDRASMSGDPAPERKTREGATLGFEVGPAGGRQAEVSATLDTRCKDGAIRNQTGMLCMAHGQALNRNHERPIVYENHANDSRIKKLNGYAPALSARSGTGGGNLPLVHCFTPCDAAHDVTANLAPTLRASVEKAVSIAGNIINRQVHNGGNGKGCKKDVSYTLTAMDRHGVAAFGRVRRLLPVECERLMGFPDNHTQIEWRGKKAEECPDGHRYKACGNSQGVNVMRWLGQRIDIVDKLE